MGGCCCVYVGFWYVCLFWGVFSFFFPFFINIFSFFLSFFLVFSFLIPKKVYKYLYTIFLILDRS